MSAVASQRLFFGIDQHIVEIVVKQRLECEQGFELAFIIRIVLRNRFFKRSVKLSLRLLRKECGIDLKSVFQIDLFGDIRHAFEGGESFLEIFVGDNRIERGDFFGDFVEISLAAGKYGGDHGGVGVEDFIDTLQYKRFELVRIERSVSLFEQIDRFVDIERQIVGDDDPYDAVDRASQRKGVFAPRRDFTDTKKPHQRIEFDTHGYDTRKDGTGQRRPFAERHILLFDRRIDQRILSERFGVVVAHQALQFGKFVDHFGHQIGFRQRHGTIEQAFDLRRRFARFVDQTLHIKGGESGGDHTLSFDLVRQRPQSVDKLHFLQALGRQSAFEVVTVEKERIFQTRTQHAFVTRDHFSVIVGQCIADDDETVVELAFFVNGKIALMFFHRRNDHFGRQFQKLLVETSRQRMRIFGDRHHLFQQRFVSFDFDVQIALYRIEIFKNTLSARLRIQRHAPSTQHFAVCVNRFHFDRSVLRHTVHASKRRTCDTEKRCRYVLLSQAHLQPSHGSDKLFVQRTPTHHFAERHRLDPLFDHLGKHVARRLALLDLSKIEHFLFALLRASEFGYVHTALTREPECGRCRFALFECGMHRRSHQLDRTIFLTRRDRIVHDAQASRRIVKTKIARQFVLRQNLLP